MKQLNILLYFLLIFHTHASNLYTNTISNFLAITLDTFKMLQSPPTKEKSIDTLASRSKQQRRRILPRPKPRPRPRPRPSSQPSYEAGVVIINRSNGQRLGDDLIGYFKALWIAHKYKVPFIHQPFTFSEHFFPKKIPDKFQRKHILARSEQTINSYIQKNVNIVLNIDLHCITDDLIEAIKDPIYKAKLQDTFLHEPKEKINIPVGYDSVAVHIRKGSRTDPPLLATQSITTKVKTNPETAISYADVQWPLKFPPNQYYINQIERLITLLPHKKLFFYIFTDDKDPEQLKKIFQQALSHHKNIIIDGRNKGFTYDRTIINDFLCMAHMNHIIRSESHFSKAAHIIGNHKIAISLEAAEWRNNEYVIDKVRVTNHYTKEEYIITH